MFVNYKELEVKVKQDTGRFAMAQVGIVMGSDSDMPVMAKAADVLELSLIHI